MNTCNVAAVAHSGKELTQIFFMEPTLGHIVALPLDVPENSWYTKDKWTWNGSKEKPTIRASVLQNHGTHKGDTQNHFFVTDGVVEYLGDCTHGNTNKKVSMVEWPYNTIHKNGVME